MDKVLYVGFNVNISEGFNGSNISNNISVEVFNFLNYLRSKYGTEAGSRITDINGISINIVPNMYYNN
jgi:hypothetical protein